MSLGDPTIYCHCVRGLFSLDFPAHQGTGFSIRYSLATGADLTFLPLFLLLRFHPDRSEAAGVHEKTLYASLPRLKGRGGADWVSAPRTGPGRARFSATLSFVTFKGHAKFLMAASMAECQNQGVYPIGGQRSSSLSAPCHLFGIPSVCPSLIVFFSEASVVTAS